MDQYLSFIAPSPSLFSLLPPPPIASTSTTPPTTTIPQSTYAILNSPSSTEQQIEAEIERVASGLFSAIATLGELSVLTVSSYFIDFVQDTFRSFGLHEEMLRKW